MAHDRLVIIWPRLAAAACALAVITLQPSSRAQVRDGTTTAAWDAGARYPDYRGPSTLTIKNDCRRAHSFSVTKQNADFLEWSFPQPVVVPARQSVQVPVTFRANVGIGDHTGMVTIKCLDCEEVPPCTQSPTTVNPHIRVVPYLTAPTAGVSRVAARVCWRLGVARTWTDDAKARNQEVLEKEKALDAARAKLADAYARAEQLERDQEAAHTKAQANTDPAQAPALKAADDAFDDLIIKAWLDVETADFGVIGAYEDLQGAEQYFAELFQLDLFFSERDCPDVITDGPVVAEAISVTEEVWDCDQYGRLADAKAAAARAAQAAADAAAADAARAARAAAASPAGKDPRDVTAAKEIADAARANQKAMQDKADDAKAVADSARRMAAACRTPSRPAIALPQVGPCPVQGDCAAAERAWREAEHQAAIAQAIADREKANQTFDAAEAAYLEKTAARDEEYAKGLSARAAQMRQLAGGAAGLEMRDREIAARSPAGSKDRTQWEKAADEDHASIAKWNKSADDAEAEALKYRMKAAEALARAKAMRGGPTDAQAKADAAKAAAAAARRQYDACQDALRRAQQDCARRAAAAAASSTVSRPPAAPAAPSTAGRGATPTPPPSMTAGNSMTIEATNQRPGLAHIPGSAGRVIDRLQPRDGLFCHWITFTLPKGQVLENVYARPPEPGATQTPTLEVKKGRPTASGDTLQYHCMVADAGAIVTYTYTSGNEAHIGRVFVSCAK